MGIPNKDIHVLICERDTFKPDLGSRPIVFEQYIDQGCASFESVKKHQQRIGNRYGQTKIAKLVFIEG